MKIIKLICIVFILFSGYAFAHSAHKKAALKKNDKQQPAEEKFMPSEQQKDHQSKQTAPLKPAPPVKLEINEIQSDAQPDPVKTAAVDHHSHFDLKKYIRWLGRFHPVAVHFPIALITMVFIAEIFFFFLKKEMFSSAALFMITAAAITSIPAVIFGFAFSYEVTYDGLDHTIFIWHSFGGIMTAVLSIFAAFFRLKYYSANAKNRVYYIILFLTAIIVSVTGYLGGALNYGIAHLLP